MMTTTEADIIRMEVAKYLPHLSDEYAQEARISIYLYRMTHPGQEVSGGLARTIVRRRLASLHRGEPLVGNVHEGHRYEPPTAVTDDDDFLEAAFGKNHPSAEYEALRRIVSDEVASAVAELPETERHAAVGVMYDVPGPEVAAWLGLTRSAVTHARSRALLKLQESLASYA